VAIFALVAFFAGVVAFAIALFVLQVSFVSRS